MTEKRLAKYAMPMCLFWVDSHRIYMAAGEEVKLTVGEAGASIFLYLSMGEQLLLIDALIRRYNWRVNKLNAEAAQVPEIAKLKPLKEAKP